MKSNRPQTEAIRTFIIRTLDVPSADIAGRVAERFQISRQATHRHLKQLIDDGILLSEGRTRGAVYRLALLIYRQWVYTLPGSPEEHVVWDKEIEPLLTKLPKNVLQILQYGFTEMFNNAVDHSEGTNIHVRLDQTAAKTSLLIHDDGVGIFKKISAALGLEDERQAMLELSKGKFTTDPSRHSGEGIFFTSRMFRPFIIMSNDIFYTHHGSPPEEWIGRHAHTHSGTSVSMEIGNGSRLKMVDVFTKFTSGEEKDFSKTVVPVRLAQYGGDLISRSQAKRVVAGLDKFSKVILDFEGVKAIGQGFSDEIFRVFQNSHPNMDLIPINCVREVQVLIDHVRHGMQRSTTSPVS